MNTLADTVAEEHAETLVKRLVKVKGEVLVDTLDDTLAGYEAETLIDTLVKVKAEALFNAQSNTRGAVSGDIFARHLAAHQRIWN